MIPRGEWVSGNVFIRSNQLAKVGDTVDGHTHNFDHTTIVFRGAVHVKATTPDGRVIEREFRAPAHFLVKADVTHAIMALDDHTEFWCVYAHREPQGRVTLDYNGWHDAYL